MAKTKAILAAIRKADQKRRTKRELEDFQAGVAAALKHQERDESKSDAWKEGWDRQRRDYWGADDDGAPVEIQVQKRTFKKRKKASR